MRRSIRHLVVAMPLAIAGCQSATRPAPAATSVPTPRTDVSYRAVAGDMPRYALDDTQTALLPEQGRANPAPAYPPQLVALRLPPVEVRATLVVDTQGRVRDVRIAGDAAVDAHRRAFDDAVRTATRQWTFTPLRIYRWIEDADGGSHRGEGAAQPFSQAYAFRFELRDGKPTVTSGHAPPPARSAR
jgi:TonB family protein